MNPKYAREIAFLRSRFISSEPTKHQEIIENELRLNPRFVFERESPPTASNSRSTVQQVDRSAIVQQVGEIASKPKSREKPVSRSKQKQFDLFNGFQTDQRQNKTIKTARGQVIDMPSQVQESYLSKCVSSTEREKLRASQ